MSQKRCHPEEIIAKLPEYNHLRPHSSLGGLPPAPETMVWPGFSLKDFASPAVTREPAPALS